MNRDYARRRSRRKTTKKSRQSTRRWPWIIVLSLIMALYGLWQFRGSYKLPWKFNLPPSKIAKINQPIELPKFEFYNIATKNSEKPITTEGYELVIASTDDFANADNLKAKLTLLGFSINLVAGYHGGVKKYQVTAGPYNSPQEAVAMQRKLKAEGIRSKLKKSN